MNCINISVIVPIYNVEKYIERCLRSLFSQTKTEGVEFILVNDATHDNSMQVVTELITEYSSLDVNIVNKEQNEGLLAARRTGMQMAKGEYIIHIDSDDWCEPTMLEEMYAKAIEEDADVVNADYYVDKGDSQYYIKNSLTKDQINNVEYVLEGRVHASLWSKLIKRTLIIDNKIELKNNFNLQEDLVLCSQVLFYAERIVNIDKAYLHYVHTPNSLTRGQINHPLRVKNSELMLNELIDFFRDKRFSDRIIDNINLRKIQLKFAIFRHLKGYEQRTKIKIYPEVNKLILGTSSMKLPKRFVLFLATHGALSFANLILKIVTIVKKYK